MFFQAKKTELWSKQQGILHGTERGVVGKALLAPRKIRRVLSKAAILGRIRSHF